MAHAGRPPPPNERVAIACPTAAGWNPYLDLLYESLEREGVPLERNARLKLGWLVASRRRVRWLHIHWPQSLYRFSRGPRIMRAPLSWVKLGLFAWRLIVARALGYRIVWTIHQVLPHDGANYLDLLAARLLATRADVLIAHDPSTDARAIEMLELGPGRIAVVTPGSYAGVYPPGEGRAAAREALGVKREPVALSFGELRAHKDVDVLLDAFGRIEREAMLVVAGHPKDKAVAAALAAAAERDPRLRFRPGFVPEELVADLFAAADVAVVARGDGGTSGSLILALTFGLPVVAADRPTYRDLLADGEAGWLFRPGEAASLAAALDAALGATEEELRGRGRCAARQAAGLRWDESARRIAALLRS